MFSYHKANEEAPLESLSPTSYYTQIRAAHTLADLLKRMRPHLYDRISELQLTINRCQQTLDKSRDVRQQALMGAQRDHTATSLTSAPLPDEVVSTLNELNDTIQALLDLRHKGQMAHS